MKDLLNEGKTLTKAEERFMDMAGNLINELRLVERIEMIGDVSRAASEFTTAEKATLELLILKANQERPLTLKALKCESVYLQLHSQTQRLNKTCCFGRRQA